MLDERYYLAAAAAAEIINLHSDPATPAPERFSRIVYTILATLDVACERSTSPSDN